MARNSNITVTIGAKDLATGVFNRVKASTVALGVALGNLATKMVSGAANMMRGWIDGILESEEVLTKLEGALRGAGYNVEVYSKKLQQQASELQSATAQSDELTKTLMTQMIITGTHADKVGEAAKMIKALAGAGYEGTMAMRAVQKAMEGDLSGFDRMIPALKNATSESEKLFIINQTMAAGWETQTARMKTVSGALEAVRGRFADLRDHIGDAILRGLKLGTTLDTIQAKFNAFMEGDAFQGFLRDLERAAETAQLLGAHLFSGKPGAFDDVFEGVGTLILGALKDGGNYVGEQIKQAFAKETEIGTKKHGGWGLTAARIGGGAALGAATGSVIPGLGTVVGAIVGAIGVEAGYRAIPEKDRFSEAGEDYYGPGAGLSHLERAVDATKKRYANLLARLQEEADARKNAAKAVADARRREREIAAQQAAGANAAAQADALRKAEQRAVAEAQQAVVIAKLRRSAANETLKSAKAQTEYDDRIKSAKERLAKAEEKLRDAKEGQVKALTQNVGEALQERKGGRKAAAKEERKNAKDLKRNEQWAKRMTARVQSGGKLNRYQQEKLADLQGIKGERAGVGVLDAQEDVAAAEEEIKSLEEQAQEARETTNDLLEEIKEKLDGLTNVP